MTACESGGSGARIHAFRGAMPLRLGEVDIAETLDGGQAFRWHGTTGGAYVGVLGHRIARICSGDGDLWVSGCDQDSDDTLVRNAREYLASGADPAVMLDRFASEPWATDGIIDRQPLRVLRQDPWECLVAFICSQNSNMPRIKKMVASVAGFGTGLDGTGKHFEFPEAAIIAELGETRLRELGLGYRAPSLAEVARRMAADDGWLVDLRSADYDDAKKELIGLPGVGPKVADCVLAYSLDKHEAFPIDVHVMRAVTRIYKMQSEAKIDHVASWARERFGEFSSLAQLYIFRSEVNRNASD